MKTALLLADNDPKFLESCKKVLARAGYEVTTASNPEQTRLLLRQRRIDLAILDVRLKAESEKTDLSGFEIAMDETFRNIPKVILTGFQPTPEDLRKALGAKVDDLPSAVAYVGKDEGPETLLEVIRRTLETWPYLRMSTVKVSTQIKEDYQTSRDQADLSYRIALTVSIVGFIVIFVGIILAWWGKLAIGIVGTASGIILQVLSYLFFKRLDLSNSRMDLYHRELLETYWLELLMAASEQLPSEKQVNCTEQAIKAAINRWLAPPTPAKRLAVKKSEAAKE
jgi:CheY-like chemotaxis protein